MHLDAFTIMLGSAALVFVCGGLFAFFWLQDRRSSWLAWWVAPYLCAAGALGLYIPRGSISDLWSIGVSNALLILGFGFVWQGARVFEARRPLLWPMCAAAAVWMLLCQLPVFLEQRPLRVIVASMLAAGFLLLVFTEFHRGRGERLPSRWPLLATTLAFAALFAVRIPLAYVAPYPWGGLPEQPIMLAAFNLSVLIMVAFFSVLMISMTKERHEARQRGFAMSDPLTGLFNRRGFADFADRMSRRRSATDDAVALLVLDLDHFKSINDRFGHDAGDRLLQLFARVSEDCVRPSDQLFRMGGEEFCFVLPETTLGEALAVAERIRQRIAGCQIETSLGHARVTVSIGLAASPHAIGIDVLLAAADAAVYEAKARGRDRVVVAEPASLVRLPVTAALQAAGYSGRAMRTAR